MFPHELLRTEGKLVDYTIYCYVLPWSWLSPVHVIHWFHVKRIPGPWLHIAYLIVLWFSHALFGRKPVRSVCPQLCKLLRVTSIICSQVRTTAIARQSPSLLSQTRLWTPVTHLHLPSQDPKLGVRPYSHSSKCASTSSPFSLFWREKVSCSTSWPWPTLRGQKDWAWSFEGRWDRGNLCEGEKRQATGWRCGSTKQRTRSMQTSPCSSSSSRHWIYAYFCFSSGRGHTRRHPGASHSSHPPLEYKVRGSQSCDTLVKMGHHTEKRMRGSFLHFLSRFLWLLQVCTG